MDDRGQRSASGVAEVVSPGARAQRRDYESKPVEYLALGLREYWIVAPERQQVAVLAREENAGAVSWVEAVFAGDETIVSRLLPGFAGRVSELWLVVDWNHEVGDVEP
jgi:Uma2 family endonuclease